MKIEVNAGEIAAALALTASLSTSHKIKGIEALAAVHIKADDDAVAISANILDHALSIAVPAMVEAAGEVAVAAERLAGVTAALPATAMVEITRDELAPVARVRCGRSRFKFPTMLLSWLPPLPKLAEETGHVELARAELLTLLQPMVAAAKEKTRFYLTGLLMHDVGSDLRAVATDGHRLVHVTIPGAAGLSQDHKLNVPAAAIKIITKMLADKTIERVTLRRSESLFAVETAAMVFTCKLIDGTFPDYARILPQPSSNRAIVARDEILLALKRARAAIEGEQRVIGLSWDTAAPALQLCHINSDVVDDAITAETAGAGRTAVQIVLLAEILEEAFAGRRVELDSRNGQTPVLITDPDNTDLLAVLMPCAWAQAARAA